MEADSIVMRTRVRVKMTKRDICAGQTSLSFIAVRVIGFTEKIIDAGIVKAGELDQDLGRDIVGADFVFGIAGLRHAQIVCNLLLTEIVIGT